MRRRLYGEAGTPWRDRAKAFAATIFALFIPAAPALAACPMELSTFRDVDDIASVEFRPTGGNAVVTNTFRLIIDDTVLDGIVMWSEGVARPNGIVTYQCPQGDVTGEEMAACTLWQGVIYTSDPSGTIGLLPAEGKDAASTLIFADLAHALRFSSVYGPSGFDKVPSDVFKISGCQE